MKYLLFISFVAFFKQFGIFLNFSRYRGNDLATCFLQMRYNTFCKVKPIAGENGACPPTQDGSIHPFLMREAA